MKFFVGAYAASPCHSQWQPEAETTYIDGLKEVEAINGLELPFFGKLHRYDSEWLKKNLPSHWDYIFTCIPGTMDNLARNPTFGLASKDPEGRALASKFLAQARDAIAELNESQGRQVVRAIEIHSAPTLGRPGIAASREIFAESLNEILHWDWQGAKIFVEHCDAFRDGQVPAKGFLELADEIAAIEALGKRAGNEIKMLINWGRSVIEGRDSNTVLAHLKEVASHELLGGLIFSGVTIDHPLYGNWADTHAPFAGDSLMDHENVVQCLKIALAQKNTLLGFKIQALPKTLTVKERISLIHHSLDFLTKAAKCA